jgi:hypothetical protein
MTDQTTSAADEASAELQLQGVPQDAMRRLAELKPGRPGSIFTSDLSVNEFLLVREVGFRPLGLVLGSSTDGAATRSSTCSPRPCTTLVSWR